MIPRYRLVCVAVLAQLSSQSAFAEIPCYEPLSNSNPTTVSSERLCVPLVPLGVTGEDFTPGCAHVYVIKADEGTHGNWGFVDLGDCSVGPCTGSGSSALEYQLAHGSQCRVLISLNTVPGARRGALRDAMASRFSEDTDRRSNICYQEYLGSGERIIVVPRTTAPQNGRHEVTVIGFAAFFLRGLPANGDDAVEGEYLYNVAQAE
jgi:hypothetical protein